ncbi:class 1 isoprenoid biosynthesis enzyme [Paraflavitalea sp. CAU 1676]|uniref:class 1 isoprenoid biosynthesis enzyme n=1 Tax=Paraflavitalea sp. CAU 1676 TaxID=3032598 RepID=UPI0023D9D92D|nr:class 1 isoprenoid biosynthesis enzyme [Paraflavitalea sp. CAU 1676]MDF2186803.1 class 1 isoprenoid biosynthesis enzyme [Paraflavitalea sp. CAU 1676]
MTANRPGVVDHTGVQFSIPEPVSLWRVLRRLVSLQRKLKTQERQFADKLRAALPAAVLAKQPYLSPKQLQRFTKYWQLALNVICENFYQLTGQELSEKEHKNILLLSLFMPLFDDLFDDRLLPYETITKLVTHPEQHTPSGETDQLVRELYIELLRGVPRRDLFIQHLLEGTHWEKESLKQLDEGISERDLYDITYNKSYYSLQLFYDTLDHYPPPPMQPMLYALAGLMQLVNDAFDVWKDTHNGIYTLPNLYRKYDELQQLFLDEMSFINQQLSQLSYNPTAKANFAITIHALHAMGWLSLQQLKQATTKISTMAELKTLSRKTLVCDMDTIPQLIKWARLVRRFSNYHHAQTPFSHNPNRPAFSAASQTSGTTTIASPIPAE